MQGGGTLRGVGARSSTVEGHPDTNGARQPETHVDTESSHVAGRSQDSSSM